MANNSIRVALVGRRLPHNENLGLCYLRAALTQAGVRVDVHYVNDAAELARAVVAILASAPALVGLSLADGGSAILPLALGEAIHRAGYGGHVTAGGQFATLARGWLLERHPWLDSVVRFAGEAPIVALAERLARGAGIDAIAGLTTRVGDGAPAQVLDRSAITVVPLRDELPEILGQRAAHMIASRGCAGRCQYCGPAALQTLERAEGAQGGHDAQTLRAAGVGSVRRRAVEPLCAEMAALYHEREVRYFYFVDEHMLPYEEGEALAFLRQLRAGLGERAVGPIGMGCMLRADRLTPAVVRAFAEAGLVRAFVGLELAGVDEARHYGRRAPGARELGLLQDFADAGVTTVSNLMLVHPDSTAESVSSGLELLASIPAGVFEATRMMVYHGTRLADRMAQEGRLLGNPLRYGYGFADPTMERFAEIFTRLRGEAFHDYSMAYRTHDAYLGMSLARRLYPERVRSEVIDRADRVRRRVNRLYVAAYRRGLELACSGGGFSQADELIRSLCPVIAELELELDRLERMVLASAPPRARMFAPMRAAAAGVFSFALASVACGSKVEVDQGGSGTGGSTTTTSSTTSSGGGGAGGCAPLTSVTSEQVQAILANGAACFNGSVLAPAEPGGPAQINASVDIYSYPGLGACPSTPAQPALTAQADEAQAALAEACVPPTALPPYTQVSGGSLTDMQTMLTDLQAACSAVWNTGSTPQFAITLDATGHVVSVTGDPSIKALTDCVAAALAGLSFPCLASFQVCPEYMIAE